MKGNNNKKKQSIKISRKSIAVLIILVITIPLLFVVIINPFSPLDVGDTTYISAGDILKNFKFETIGTEPIVDEGAFNNKLRFDRQASWILYKDDITTLNTPIESNGSTYLKYRIVLRNKINMYTNVRLSQLALDTSEKSTDYLGMHYVHKSIENKIQEEWWEYITWEHYDFGDIKKYNEDNNYFSGRITMSFDIDDNPIPNTFGEYTEKNFDYIAVSDAGIVTNTHGLMSTDMPDIVVLEPNEDGVEGNEPAEWELGELQHTDNDYAVQIFPNVDLVISPNPTTSYDSSILPDTSGSSLDPTTKEGNPLWDPEDEVSMTGCLINYDLGALSPVVYKYTGTLTYNEYFLHTEHEYTENLWDFWATYVDEKSFYWSPKIKYNDVALHGINRYIQVDMYVAFDIWASVNIGTLTEYYEQMRLEAPTEYYDALIWSTLAGGWTGSEIREGGDPVDDIWESIGGIFEGLFGDLGGILTLIIVIAIGGVGGYIFLVVGIPALKARQRRKEYEYYQQSQRRNKYDQQRR